MTSDRKAQETRYLVELFGSLTVWQGKQRAIRRFRTHKTGALLAYLAYHRERMHPREVLIELFWPESPSLAARNNLSSSLSSLRGQLEPPGIPAESVLLADRLNVGLASTAVSTDVAQFDDRLDQAEVATSEAARAALWAEAVSLYRAELLPGYYDAWIAPAQERLDQRFLGAARRLIRLYEAQGALSDAIAYAQRAVARAPFAEDAFHDLIRLLIAADQPAEALRQFHQLERQLEEEMGETPSQATLALVEPLRGLTPRETRDAPGAPERRRRSGRPSVAPACLAEPAVSSPPMAASPSQTLRHPVPIPESPPLPLPLTRFFGRENELRQLGALLRNPALRLVTLTGPGGTGKTRLALAAAQELCDRGEGSVIVHFAPLASLSEGRLLAEALQEALDLTPDRTPKAQADPFESVVAALAEPPSSLLVLDNFEQLAQEEDGAAALLVETLLTCVPTLTCLVTSRQRLRLEGEHEFAVPPLPTPEGVRRAAPGVPAAPVVSMDNPAALLAASPSVALFVDRAQMARPDFTITARNAPVIAELVTRLDGIPLSIELAAARAQVLTPQRMLDQLSQRFDLLVSRRWGGVNRHRSLREAIAWSLDLLSPDLRRLFAWLSIFRGGGTIEAAEAILEEGIDQKGAALPVLDGLAQLRDASLIGIEESVDEGLRFTMLETLREFAQEQLPEAERKEACRLHARYFAGLAEAAVPHLQGQGQALWFDQLEADHSNFRAALEWSEAAASAEAGSIGLRLCGALHGFWRVRGYLNEGRRRIRAALAHPAVPSPHGCSAAEFATLQEGTDRKALLLAKVLNGAGTLALVQGDLTEARDLYAKSLYVRREVNDSRGIAATLNNLAIVEGEEGYLDRARGLHEESLSLWRELSDRSRVATVLANLGTDALRRNDFAAARTFFEESLQIAREVGDVRGQAIRLRNLGEIDYKQERFDCAERRYQESLLLLHLLKDTLSIAYSLLNIAFVASVRGGHVRANRLIGAALNCSDAISAPFSGFEQEELLRHENLSRRAIGAEAMVSAQAEGRLLTLDEAILYARGEADMTCRETKPE